MKKQTLKILKFLIGWPLSLIALYYIWRMVYPQSANLISGLRNINVFLLIIGIVGFITYYYLRSYVWHRLLREEGHMIPFRHSSFLWSISELKRYIPGKFWFALGRALAFSEKGVSKKDTARLIIIELEIFVVSSLIVALLGIPFLQRYFFGTLHFANWLILFAEVLIWVFVLSYIFSGYFVNKLDEKVRRLIGPLLPNNSPTSLTFLIFLCSLSLVFYGSGSYFVISAIKIIDPQLLPELIGFFTFSFFVGFLSFFTPAGLGVREGAVALGLAKILSFGTAGFVSLFSRVLLIISELIFVTISLILVRIKNRKFLQTEKWIAEHPQVVVLFCLVFLYIAYFTIASFLRYDNFYTGRFDLGNMAQTVWNTSRGRIFVLTNPNATENISRLAFHADFILVLFAPAYQIWSNPKILLLIQTLIVGTGAFFVYLIARDVLKSKNIALVFSFVYLINPSIQRANLYDFHAVTLVTFFLLGTHYFYSKKKYFYFSLFAILAALTKEEIWLVTGLFGIFIFIFQKKRLFGSVVFLVSVAAFYFLIWHAIPGALGAQHFALSYYSEFGDSPSQIIKTALLSPQKIFMTFFEVSRLDYLNKLFLPVGFLSVLSPFLLVFAAPDLLIDLLSNNVQLHQIYYQYTAPISPFIFISAIFGLRRLRRIIKIREIFPVIFLLITSCYGAYYFGPMPGALESNLDMFTKSVDEDKQIENYISKIPRRVSVAASNNLGSHLSQRQRIYTVPQGIGKADVIVFLLTNPYSEKAEREMVSKLKQSNEYYLELEKDKFIVFKKK